MTTEDNVSSVQTKVQILEKDKKDLEGKILNLEPISRGSNLRLVNLPEGAKGEDACSFLENWLPDALDLKLTVKRAHKFCSREYNSHSPRTLIMTFLNLRDKELVTRAANL